METEISLIIGLIVSIGGAILAFSFKMTRCITRHETCIQHIQKDLTEIKDDVKSLVNSLLSHIDKH